MVNDIDIISFGFALGSSPQGRLLFNRSCWYPRHIFMTIIPQRIITSPAEA
jgi:hypothetical protein